MWLNTKVVSTNKHVVPIPVKTFTININNLLSDIPLECIFDIADSWHASTISPLFHYSISTSECTLNHFIQRKIACSAVSTFMLNYLQMTIL